MTALEKAKALCRDLFGTDQVVIGGEDLALSIEALIEERDLPDAQTKFTFPTETI